MKFRPETRKICFIGDYSPRRCGIATFTKDLCVSVASRFPKSNCFVIPVNDSFEGYDYPEEVRFEIDEQDLGSYQRAADFINISDADVVCVQHEFGIYGGTSGGHILALLREINLPVVTTLHTILKEPSPDQKRVMKELIRLSTRLVVMSEKGKEILQDIYSAPLDKIDMIYHGIPEMPFVDPGFYKDIFGVEGKQVLLTFGLMSPNKGIEYVLNALPGILEEFPDVVYIILGATHPHLLREQGEVYRLKLESIAKKNKVDKSVIFYNRFVENEELKEFIGAADIYITPYLNEAQITSGTLSYCFGSGKAVISTPYWHACELLDENRGVLVPFRDSGSIENAVRDLLGDEPRRNTIRKNAYKMGRDMVWSNVACLYMQTFEKARMERASHARKLFPVKTLDKQLGHLPEIKLDHIIRMTDSTGIFQHAVIEVPNFSTGYCTDDNSRALMLMLNIGKLREMSDELTRLANTYAAFILHAFDPGTRKFRNFMSFDRKWVDEAVSEDTCGRALLALGTCVGRSDNPEFQMMAAQIFDKALEPTVNFTSPRAWALVLVGIHEYLRRLSGDRLVNQTRELLMSKLMDLHERTATDRWPWFEDTVTYDNAKLPHALILSGKWTNRPDVFETGLKTLRWLTEIQTAEGGYFRPIGSNGFYKRDGEKQLFDQQPLEALAMISACLEAYRATSDDYWIRYSRQVFDWFMGSNDLGAMLYDPRSGGCRDGLHIDRVNQNQGAESSLAFLMSLVAMRKIQNDIATFNSPDNL